VKVWEIGGDKEPETLDGHTDRVSYAAFSPDGKWLATGSDKELLLWDAAKLELVKKIETPARWLAFEPSGESLLSGGFSQVITRWDLDTFEGKSLPELSRKGGHVLFHLSRDGKTLFSLIADDGKHGETAIRLYDAADGKPIERQGHAGQVWAVAASPDGKLLASAGEDGTVRLWDLASGKQLHAVARPGQASAVAFSPDSRMLAAHWRKGSLTLFYPASGKEVRTLSDAGDFRHVSFSPDGALLAASGQDGQVRVWEAVSGQFRLTFRAGTGAAYSSAFSPDGKVLAAGSADGGVTLWDLAADRAVGNLPKQAASVHWVGFHPDGRSLAVAGEWEGRHVLIYDLATGKETHRLTGHQSSVVSGAWRADGRLLATVGDADGALRLWNLSQSPPRSMVVQVQPRDTKWLHGVALTPEGRYAALATADGTIPVLRLPDPPRPTP
jgi:WD40 repeat protein